MNSIISQNKKSIFIMALLLVANFAFCQATGGSKPLSKALATVLGFFESGYMKAILTIALGVLGIGLIQNRGEPGMMKKFVPWIAACIILLSLSAITGIIFPADGTSIEADTSNLNNL